MRSSALNLANILQGFAASFAQANAAAVVLIGRTAADLAETEKLVNRINPDIQILSIPLDVTDTAGVTKAFEAIVARFGAPHVLINNAGYINPLDSIADVDVDLWWRTQVRLFFGRRQIMIHPENFLSK